MIKSSMNLRHTSDNIGQKIDIQAPVLLIGVAAIMVTRYIGLGFGERRTCMYSVALAWVLQYF